jgi:hypothetical protein
VVEEGSGVRGQGGSGGVVTMATRAWRYYSGGEHKRAVLDHSVVLLAFYLTFSKSCSGFVADLFTVVPAVCGREECDRRGYWFNLQITYFTITLHHVGGCS